MRAKTGLMVVLILSLRDHLQILWLMLASLLRGALERLALVAVFRVSQIS